MTCIATSFIHKEISQFLKDCKFLNAFDRGKVCQDLKRVTRGVEGVDLSCRFFINANGHDGFFSFVTWPAYRHEADIHPCLTQQRSTRGNNSWLIDLSALLRSLSIYDALDEGEELSHPWRDPHQRSQPLSNVVCRISHSLPYRGGCIYPKLLRILLNAS